MMDSTNCCARDTRRSLPSGICRRARRPWSRTTVGLNQAAAYTVGTARFECPDEAALHTALEGIGSRIVFLIDWNHARKRLQSFVEKDEAIAVLTEAARLDVGHRAWLQVGGERVVFAAMQDASDGAFRIGDRLDEVLGVTDARAFLVAVMQLSSDALRHAQPAALVADEIRMLLARHVSQRSTSSNCWLNTPRTARRSQRRSARVSRVGYSSRTRMPRNLQRARRRGNARPIIS